MTLETITREEFDKRLDAANTRRAQELQRREEQQAEVEQLLSHYENTLTEVEAELENERESIAHSAPSARLRNRLKALAEKTARVAASV